MKSKFIQRYIVISAALLMLICTGCGNPFQPNDKGEYQIAFDIRGHSNNVSDIYLMNADGEDKIQLTQRPSDIDEESFYWSANPIWSPDGEKILYKSYQNGTSNLYTITPDGKELNQVTDFPGNESVDNFAWSPNGEMVAVNTDSGIYIMNDNGGGQERITDKPVWDLSWSPDGSKIVFTTIVQSEDSTSNMGVINVVNADGSDLKQVTTKERNGRFPSWIPGINKIILTAGDWSNEKSIHTMNANGGEQQEIISDYLPTALSVSPDGNRIAFLHYVTLYVHDLYVVDIAGKGLRKLNPDNIAVDGCGSLSWSPDGNIMIGCGYNMETHPAEYGIYKVKSDGSKWSFLGAGDNPHWSPVRID